MSGGPVEDGWELYTAGGDETEVHLARGRVAQIRSELRFGAAARVVCGGRLGSATATGAVDRARLLGQAGQAAALGAAHGFTFPGPSTYGPVEVYDPEVASLGPDELVAWALGLDREFQRLAGRPLACAIARRAATEVEIENSSGCWGRFRRTELEVRLEASDQTWAAGLTTRLRFEQGRLVERLAGLAAVAGRREDPPEGRVPVLFAPPATAYLLRPLLANLDGGALASGASAFSGTEAVAFQPGFWLWEDGTLADFTGSAPFDGEGVPTRRNVLIEAGRQVGALVDCATAARLGREPNGTAVREEFPGLPAPGVNNLEMAAGTAPVTELMAGLDPGLVVYDLMSEDALLGSQLAAQVHSGFLVRGGRMRGRVENAMIHLDLDAAWRDAATAFSRERERVGGTLLLPYVLVCGVAVGRG